MLKRNFTLFLIFILITGAAVFWIINNQSEKGPVNFPSDRAMIYSITGGKDFPVFEKELIIDPYKVKEGEIQTFSIWVKDLNGVEKVTAVVATDAGEKIIKLKLTEGTKEDGRWQGFWTTKNISSQLTYSTIIQATNKDGKEIKISPSWETEK